jgi:hypothetical protein
MDAMSLIITAIFVAALSLAWGAAMSALVRRRARAQGDEAILARVTMAGSRRQRVASLRFAAGFAIAGVGLLSAGAGQFGQVLVILAVALVMQAGVLELVARRRGDDPGDGALNRE